VEALPFFALLFGVFIFSLGVAMPVVGPLSVTSGISSVSFLRMNYFYVLRGEKFFLVFFSDTGGGPIIGFFVGL